jgi:predicted RNase H-like nuclease (RuvC/YqgF family)
MALDSFSDPGYARVMINHANATIDNLSAENHKLSANIHNLTNENEALKRKVKDLEGLVSLVDTAALKTEARRLKRMIGDLDAQEEELLSRLHSSEEGSSQEHKQSKNQDTTTAGAEQFEHDAGDDDASSSSSVTEDGMANRFIEVEDAAAAGEQDLTDSVRENSTATSNITVPGWKQVTAAELMDLAQGNQEVFTSSTASAAGDRGPTDDFAGVLGRGHMGGDYMW